MRKTDQDSDWPTSTAGPHRVPRWPVLYTVSVKILALIFHLSSLTLVSSPGLAFGPVVVGMNSDLYRSHEFSLPEGYVGKSGVELIAQRREARLPSVINLEANETVVFWLD